MSEYHRIDYDDLTRIADDSAREIREGFLEHTTTLTVEQYILSVEQLLQEMKTNLVKGVCSSGDSTPGTRNQMRKILALTLLEQSYNGYRCFGSRFFQETSHGYYRGQ